MKQILIATTNPGKVRTTKKILAKLGYDGLSFSDLNLSLKEPIETKPTAEAIAAEKAIGYARQFKGLPVLARDDVTTIIGVKEEDDPKNHNKEFIIKKMGKYSDENGEKVFAAIAHKYGGELPVRFEWGYALAWQEGTEAKVASSVAITDMTKIKLVDQISPKKSPGFSFASVLKVLVNGKWKYDSELTEDENWEVYWNLQKAAVKSLIDECPSLSR